MTVRCKICRNPKAGPGLVKGALDGWSPTDAYAYARQFDFTFSEPTWYLHSKHVRADAAAAKDAPPPPPAPVATNRQVLEAIRDRGYADMMNGKTTMLKETLTAVKALMDQKPEDDARSFLSLLTTGHAPRIQVMDAIPTAEEI